MTRVDLAILGSDGTIGGSGGSPINTGVAGAPPVDVQAALAAYDATLKAFLVANYASLTSPTFVGDPRGPNPPPGDSDQSLATTSWTNDAIQTAINGLTPVASAPSDISPPVLSNDRGILSPFPTNMGDLLYVSNGTWAPPPTGYGYQWYRSANSDGSSPVLITGATSGIYTTVTGDIGDYLYAAVTATNSKGSATADSGVTSSPVLNNSVTPPAIQGTAGNGFELVGSMPSYAFGTSPVTGTWGSGQLRTAGNLLICWAQQNSLNTSPVISGGWTNAGAFAYSTSPSNHGAVFIWYKIAAGGDAAPIITNGSQFFWVQCAEFSGNTASPLDQTATSSANVSTSPVVATASGLDANAGALIVYAGGATYSVSNLATLDVTLNNGASANDTNNANATLNNFDFGYGITTGNGSDDSASLAFTTTNIDAAGIALASFDPAVGGLPVLSGTATVGNTLTTTTGVWSNSPTSVAYQWLLLNAAGTLVGTISGAVGASFTIPSSVQIVGGASQSTIGYYIQPVVLASNAGGTGTASPAGSGAGPVVAAGAGPGMVTAPVLSGSAVVGATLTTSNGTWTNSPTSYTYQWYYTNGTFVTAISGATNSTFTLTSAYVGYQMQCLVTAINAYGSNFAYSAASAVVAATGPPTNITLPVISGTPVEGNVLTVSNGTWTGSPISYSWQWYLVTTAGVIHTVIGSNNQPTFSIPIGAGDSGYCAICAVTATNASGSSNPATSAQTAVITSGSVAAPTNSVAPAITGTDTQGQTLTCSTGTWTGSPTYTYQWADVTAATTPIAGATSSTYVLALSDVGAQMQCTVTATNSGGSAQVSSALTSAVTGLPGGTGSNVVNATPTGPPVPSGGWTCILADAFANTGNYTALSSLWYPNRNDAGHDLHSGTPPLSNEAPFANSPKGLTAHNASQVSITSNGLVLACQYVNPAQNGYNYISGTIDSRNAAATGGASHVQSPGFSWLPNKSIGATWAFEILCTFPSNVGGGSDPGWWCTDGPWAIEVDFIEYWGWEGGTDGGLTTLLSWINNGSQATKQNSGYQSFVQDGQQHRITHVFKDAAETVTCYLDGVSLGQVATYPSTWSTAHQMGLIISYEMRSAATFTNTRYWTVRSAAVYVDTPHAGSALYTGGGTASGTVVQ